MIDRPGAYFVVTNQPREYRQSGSIRRSPAPGPRLVINHVPDRLALQRCTPHCKWLCRRSHKASRYCGQARLQEKGKWWEIPASPSSRRCRLRSTSICATDGDAVGALGNGATTTSLSAVSDPAPYTPMDCAGVTEKSHNNVGYADVGNAGGGVLELPKLATMSFATPILVMSAPELDRL